MSSNTLSVRLHERRPATRTLVYWGAILNTQLLLVILYSILVSGPPGSLRGVFILVMPWIWLDISWWAYRNTSMPRVVGRRKTVAALLAGGYFLVLAFVGGVLLPGIGERATGLRLVTYQIPPGFAPALLYSGERLVVNLIPYKVVGYLALAWLVYGTVADASGSVGAGVLGLFSCVSCVLPVIAGVLTTVTGSAGFAATIGQQSYLLSTTVFVVTVLLLRWRPTMADLARFRP
ncbi:MAG: hypothetical protein U5K28_11530 [Halobacteriales archaeon]|nr:hypothetical protein [Halobacteriales archaeon]